MTPGAPDNLHRIVPRHDMAGDAMGFTQGVDRIAIQIGNRLPMHLVGCATVKLHVAGQRHGIIAGLGQRFADIHGFKFCKQIDIFQHQLADTGQDAGPLNSR